jgi:aryl-alcohol dehydrogenase-like predicted oxidoreductase
VEHRALGASGIEVSVLSLGSWQTYERMPREDGIAVMEAARAAGIDFLDELVGMVGELVESGKLRAWGGPSTGPESSSPRRAASRRRWVSRSRARRSFRTGSRIPRWSRTRCSAPGSTRQGASVVASYVLAGGALTVKYAAGGAGRLAGEQDDPRRRRWFEVGDVLRRHAAEVASTPARLAITFALAGPRVASVLFGATSPEQVEENVGAIDTLAGLGEGGLRSLRTAVGSG